MTTKELSEVAGCSENTVREVIHSLFPSLIKNGVKTDVDEKTALQIMSRLPKRNLVAPSRNHEAIPSRNHEARSSNLPAADQMREMIDAYGREEAGKRIDFLIGYSRKYDPPKQIEAPLDAKIQPELFNGIFAKLAEAKKL